MRSIYKDFLNTGLTSVITVFGLLIHISLLNRFVESNESSLYLLLRRYTTFLEHFLTFGASIAIIHYIAKYKNHSFKFQILTSLIVITLVINLSLLIIFLITNFIIRNYFHDYNFSFALIAIWSCYNLFYSIFIIYYAWLRSKKIYKEANLLQLIIIAVFPIIVTFFFSTKTSSTEIYFYLCIPFLFVIIKIFKHLKIHSSFKFLDPHVKKIFFLGIRKIPGLIFQGLLVTVTSATIAYFADILLAGYFLISIMILRGVEGIFDFTSRTLLARFAYLSNQRIKFNKLCEIYLQLVIILSSIFTLIIFCFIPFFTFVVFGKNNLIVESLMELLSISVFSYLIFSNIRMLLDAKVPNAVIGNIIALTNVFMTLVFLFILHATNYIFNVKLIIILINLCNVTILFLSIVNLKKFIEINFTLSNKIIIITTFTILGFVNFQNDLNIYANKNIIYLIFLVYFFFLTFYIFLRRKKFFKIINSLDE
jgi:hypothetical protein